jgi:hypothetical protein
MVTTKLTDAQWGEKIADADTRASQWLASGNLFLERGLKQKAEDCHQKAQYWLDRSNTLTEARYAQQAKAR